MGECGSRAHDVWHPDLALGEAQAPDSEFFQGSSSISILQGDCRSCNGRMLAEVINRACP